MINASCQGLVRVAKTVNERFLTILQPRPRILKESDRVAFEIVFYPVHHRIYLTPPERKHDHVSFALRVKSPAALVPAKRGIYASFFLAPREARCDTRPPWSPPTRKRIKKARAGGI